jgi:ABC-2 type transport system permease protein
MRLLIKAELIRIWRRPLYLVTVAIAAFFVVLPFVFFVLSKTDPKYISYLEAYSGFPDGAYELLRLALKLMPIALAVLAAGAASEDYSAGTLKIVLPRVASRTRVLLAKHIAVITAGFVLLVGLFLSVVLTGMLVRLFAGLELSTGPFELRACLGTLLFLFLQSLYTGVVSIFVVTLTRSQALGIVLAMTAPLLMRLLVFLPGGHWLPGIQFDVIELSLLPGSRFSTEELASVLGSQPSFPGSLVAVSVFCVAMAGLSAVLFERRDVR